MYKRWIESYQHITENITKQTIGTQIKIPRQHKWAKDFRGRFINHEIHTNT